MSKKKVLRAIRDICGGEHAELKKLGHSPCKNYDASKIECHVLRSRRVPDVHNPDHEQCKMIVMYYADTLLKEKWHKDRQVTDHEELNFKALFRRLHNKSLKGFDAREGQRYDLDYWYGYVKKAVTKALLKRLKKLKVIPEKRVCGTCRHLLSDGHANCGLEHIVSRRTGRESGNPFFGKLRSEDDSPCLGYRPTTISLLRLPKADVASEFPAEAIERAENAACARVRLSSLLEELERGMRDPTVSQKQKDLLHRRRTLMMRLVHLLRQGVPKHRMCSELRTRTTDDKAKRESLRKEMKEDREDLKSFFTSGKK